MYTFLFLLNPQWHVLGYSVDSGTFISGRSDLYAAGAPRAADYVGQVSAVYDYNDAQEKTSSVTYLQYYSSEKLWRMSGLRTVIRLVKLFHVILGTWNIINLELFS